MGITTKTIAICCCDVCGSECVPEDGEVRVQVNSGDWTYWADGVDAAIEAAGVKVKE